VFAAGFGLAEVTCGVAQFLVVRPREIMKLTIFILLLPVTAFLIGLVGTRYSHTFHPAFFWAWFLSSIICLERGFRIFRYSRSLSWTCIAVGIIPFVVIGWVMISRGGVHG
jgi:hypothetical protein